MPSAATIKRMRSLWGHCMREAEKRLKTHDKHAIRLEGQRIYDAIKSEVKREKVKQ